MGASLKRATLGFDIGGGSGRALVLDPASGEAVVAQRAWPAAGADLDLERVFQSLVEAAREARAKAGEPEILAIASAGMRFGSVVLAADGSVLLATANRDARAVGEAFAAAASAGETLERITGHWPSPIGIAPRLRWLRDNAPAQFARIGHVLSLDGWMAWRLCGEVAMDASQAGGTGLYAGATAAFDAEAAKAWGVSLEGMARLAGAGDRLGSLRPEAAERLGVRAGIPVAVGGADSQLAAAASGASADGATALVCGTTLPIQRVVAGWPAPPPAGLWTEPHVLPGRYVVESNAGPTGESLDWIAQVLHPDAPVPALGLLANAGRAPAGAAGLSSHFGVQVMNARAMSLPVGELTLSHMLMPGDQAGDAVARALVEGLAFGSRANVAQLDSALGAGNGALVLSGGMVRSETWARVLAGVHGAPVDVPAEVEATALGAALCAGVAAGEWPSLADAAVAVVKTRTVEPEADDIATYEAGFERWCALRDARADATALAQGHAIGALLSGAGGQGGPEVSARPRILVTADLDAGALERLSALGEVESASYREVGRLLSGASLVEALRGFEVFVTEIDLVDGASLIELPELRAVGVCRGDAVNVDAVACAKLGIPVVHTPGRNADAVADLALAFMLALARKLPEATAFLRDPAVTAGDMGAMGRAFGTLRGHELWGKTVGLVGLGAVGRKVAARVLPFGARVLVHDPFLSDEQVALASATAASLDDLLAESDFVSLHAPVVDATRGLIDGAALARMKPGACLVNTARAALVDEAALAEALASGTLAGAALDVFGIEPPGADHPLLQFPNVIATPHMGGNTFEVGAHQGEIIVGELERLLGGERPHHLLEPAALAGFALDGPRPLADAATQDFLRNRPAPAVTDLQRDAKQKPAAATVSDEGPAAATLPEAEVAALRAVLDDFASAFGRDDAMAKAAQGRDVTLRFVATDAALEIFLRLRDGEATAAVGAPDREPEVELRMTAGVLDGILSGELNALEAATAGEIAFSGDAGKAMTIQELQGDLERMYRAAAGRSTG